MGLLWLCALALTGRLTGMQAWWITSMGSWAAPFQVPVGLCDCQDTSQGWYMCVWHLFKMKWSRQVSLYPWATLWSPTCVPKQPATPGLSIKAVISCNGHAVCCSEIEQEHFQPYMINRQSVHSLYYSLFAVQTFMTLFMRVNYNYVLTRHHESFYQSLKSNHDD